MVFRYVLDPEEVTDPSGFAYGKLRYIVVTTSEDLRQIIEDSCSVNGNETSQSVTHLGGDVWCGKSAVLIAARSQYLSRKRGMSINARKRCSRVRALEGLTKPVSRLEMNDSRMNQHAADHPHGLGYGCLWPFIKSRHNMAVCFAHQRYKI